MKNQQRKEPSPPSDIPKRTRRTPRYASPRRRRKERGSSLRRLISILLMVVICLCAIGLGAYAGMLVNERERLQQLSETVRENTVTAASTTPSTEEYSETSADDPQTTNASSEATEPVVKTILPQYAQLYQENSELFGWIKIDDTVIDYPVMYSPDDPEKYLHTNFDEQYSYAGLPFVDAACTESSDNLLIYGHNMLNGSMFRSLLKYENRDFWKVHPIIKLDTLYEEQKYEVLAAFYDRVYHKDENVFKFYQFIDAEDEQHFDNAIDNFKAKQLYETGVTASYGDQLITLVTCAYHTDNGRFVVVARRVSE